MHRFVRKIDKVTRFQGGLKHPASRLLSTSFTSGWSTSCEAPRPNEIQTPSRHNTNDHNFGNARGRRSMPPPPPFEYNSYTAWYAMMMTAVVSAFFLNNTAENCGIVGVVGKDDATGFILEGLTILRNRGYDSAGIATISTSGEELFITKFASRDTTSDSIDLVRGNSAKHIGHFTGIGHTRWATHGGKTDQNAHPHTDQHYRVAVIHNGTINNAYELKKELQEKGIKFLSETDTEVIAQLIGVYLDKGFDTRDAVANALAR